MWTGFPHFLAFSYLTRFYLILGATFVRKSYTYTQFAKKSDKT